MCRRLGAGHGGTQPAGVRRTHRCCPARPPPQAHRLKNDATLTNRALDSLACRRRVLLSGTPLQNRLDEFYGVGALPARCPPFPARHPPAPAAMPVALSLCSAGPGSPACACCCAPQGLPAAFAAAPPAAALPAATPWGSVGHSRYARLAPPPLLTAMVSFCNPGVLGSPAQFRRHFEAPILAGREPGGPRGWGWVCVGGGGGARVCVCARGGGRNVRVGVWSCRLGWNAALRLVAQHVQSAAGARPQGPAVVGLLWCSSAQLLGAIAAFNPAAPVLHRRQRGGCCAVPGPHLRAECPGQRVHPAPHQHPAQPTPAAQGAGGARAARDGGQAWCTRPSAAGAGSGSAWWRLPGLSATLVLGVASHSSDRTPTPP